jgi:hypothetical protein
MTDATPDLDPADRAWLERRATLGSCVLGAVSILTSPFALGLLFGALALRGSIDMRRRGIRGALPLVGIVLGFAGTSASIAFAIVWGSLLVGVLLGRDAIRQTEQWRGRTLEATTIELRDGGRLGIGADGDACARTALVFIDASSPVAAEALASTAAAALLHERCCVIVIDLSEKPDAAARALAGTGAALRVAVAAQRLPSPLDAVAATPTTVVIDSARRIEAAVVGVRPREDLEKLFRGDAAIKP